MNRNLFLLLTLLPLFSGSASAYEYKPLVEEGKVWHMVFEPYLEDADIVNYDYFIEGDTVIAGHQCKKVYTRNRYDRGEVVYVKAAFEEGRRVSVIDHGQEEAYVVFDFNLSAGDTFSMAYVENLTFLVREVRIINVHGIDRRAFCIVCQSEPDDAYLSEPKWWIEGIGCIGGPFTPSHFLLMGYSSCFMSCEMNGSVICDEYNFWNLNAQSVINCDVTGDGVVDIDDVNAVINVIVKR